MNITHEKVREVLMSRMESDRPDEVLEVFKKNAGKPFTKRILSQLPGGEKRWMISHVASSMTNLEEHSYGRKDSGGISLLVAHSIKNITIDPDALERFNPGHFSARKERNKQRMEAANDLKLCMKMAMCLTSALHLREGLKASEKELSEFTGYDQPFAADRYEWERLSGKGE